MSQSSFLRIASVQPADVLLSDYEPFTSLGSGTYGISEPASVSDKTGPQVDAVVRQVYRKKKTCGWSSLKSAKAVFFDMDSTVVAEETIVELARFAGKEAEVAAITERAMLGELDFMAALKERVATLAGLSSNILWEVSQRMTVNKGMQAFAGFCREIGVPIFLVSGGFMEVATPFQRKIGFADIRANCLAVRDGLLTGETDGPVIDGEAKLQFMLETCGRLGILPEQAAAVGDGANDLPMLKAAGIGVGFMPRPVLLEHVQAAIFDGDHRFLAPLLFGRSCEHTRCK
jgi:phosphoserine phosphatase